MSDKPLKPEHERQLERLAAMTDDEIDTTDIPEASAESWQWARRGGGRPRLSDFENAVRVDPEVLDWFRKHAPAGEYQAEINRVLRRHLEALDSP